MPVKDTLEKLDSSKLYSVWLKAYKFAVLFSFLYLTLGDISSIYIGSLYRHFYKPLSVALICSYVLFRRMREGVEVKLFFLYCVWLVVVRFFDGGLFVVGTKDFIVKQGIGLPLLAFAMLVPADKRLKWLDIMAAVFCAAYTVIGVFCIYGAIHQIIIMNPLEDGIALSVLVGGRLFVLQRNCNDCGEWYFMACSFLVYLFFRYKKKLPRLLMVIAFIVCYLVISLTYSRSCTLSFAVSTAVLVVMLVFHRFPMRKLTHKVAVLVVLMCICTPLVYKSFNVSTVILSDISASVLKDKQEETTVAPDTTEDPKEVSERLNGRAFNGSGREEIWLAAVESLLDDPVRLFTGSIYSMELTNQYLEEHMPEHHERFGPHPHHHSSYVEMLMYAGLPGFLLMIALIAILGIKAIRLFFVQKDGATLAVKSLPAMLAGMLVYNLVQTSLLYIHFYCTAIFFVVAGYILAYEKELCRTGPSTPK